MPTTPATEPPPPEVDTEGTPPPAEPDQAEPDSNGWGADGTWPNWAYTGPDRIYSNIPITATTGAIITWPTDPGIGDGCWTTTDDDANTRPDNWRPEPTHAEAAKARGDATDDIKEG
jgi:hypothetical protein